MLKLKKSYLGVNTFCFFEVVVLLTLLTMVDFFFYDGKQFINVYPHPFWLVLLVVLFQYGIHEALMTVVVMTFFLYFIHIPTQALDQSLFEYWYSLSKRPALWLIASVILGGLKTKRDNRVNTINSELEKARKQGKDIHAAYTKLQEMNRQLEYRIAEEHKSFVKVYDIIRALEEINETNRLETTRRIICSLLQPEKFSVYRIENNELTLDYRYNWQQDDKFSEKFSNSSDIYNNIVRYRKFLCITRIEGEVVLGEEGVLAGPILDKESQRVFGMLKIEKLSYASLNTRNLHLFKLLCEWLGIAYGKIENASTWKTPVPWETHVQSAANPGEF